MADRRHSKFERGVIAADMAGSHKRPLTHAYPQMVHQVLEVADTLTIMRDGGQSIVVRGYSRRVRRPSAGVLDAFVRLARRSDATIGRAVLAFARRYGALELCRPHLKPLHHATADATTCDELCFCQPVDAYRRLAREVRLAIELGIRAQQRASSVKQPTPLTELAQQLYDEMHPVKIDARHSREVLTMERGTLQGLVSRWLRYAQIEPVVRFNGEKATFLFLGNSVWGTLGLNLALTVCGNASLAICSKCGDIFLSPRARPANRKNDWCTARACQQAARAAAQRTYAKKRRDRGS